MTATHLPTHPFCEFCDHLTEQAKVTLDDLQNRHDLNINLLLYCYWFAVNHYGLLNKAQIKRLIAAIYAWRQRIVTPLQVLYQQLTSIAPHFSWPADMITQATDTKLTAEQIEQLLITEIFPKKIRRHRPPVMQIATHAYLNIGTYCQVIYIHLDDADYIRLGEIMTYVFPELELGRATALCRHTLGEQKAKEPMQHRLRL